MFKFLKSLFKRDAGPPARETCYTCMFSSTFADKHKRPYCHWKSKNVKHNGSICEKFEEGFRV